MLSGALRVGRDCLEYDRSDLADLALKEALPSEELLPSAIVTYFAEPLRLNPSLPAYQLLLSAALRGPLLSYSADAFRL